mgnify:CR=1 FL=1
MIPLVLEYEEIKWARDARTDRAHHLSSDSLTLKPVGDAEIVNDIRTVDVYGLWVPGCVIQ